MGFATVYKGIDELTKHSIAEGGAIVFGDTGHLIGAAGNGIKFDQAKAVTHAAIG